MSVTAHLYSDIALFTLLACLSLFSATYALFTGIAKYEHASVQPKLARQTRFFFFVGLGIVTVASTLGSVANAITSLMMAVMLLLCDGAFYQQKKPVQTLFTVIRATLVVHAFVMFFQGTVIFVQMASGGESDTQALFNVTLLSHLLLTIATAALLPLLHTISKKEYWKKVANHDDLTGLLSRRAFIASALDIINQQENGHFSLLIVDIDYFKQINDQYGHQAGDEVLRTLATTLESGTRDNDIVGRLGGEEFAILMPGLSADFAQVVANRMLDRIADNSTTFNDVDIQATVSIGIATSTGIMTTWDELFSQADSALYTAKQRGRNLVFTYTPAMQA
ncbi:hypothetical protein GCM10007391_29970 [Alteromonas halophila]|uniref:diguanylate cyclase n=2 Tax=Alteromonas halophila TaxID=516698 RepID=A0A918JNV8_9ALTE|nr:hypothetical protein GCM10007391_29970 [Alteromonas halophila]